MTKQEKILKRALEMAANLIQDKCVQPSCQTMCGKDYMKCNVDDCHKQIARHFIRKAKESICHT